MEAHRIAGGEAADQRAHPVRVAQVEVGMVATGHAPPPACRQLRHRLDGEPLVQHQVVVVPGARGSGQRRRRARGQSIAAQHRQRRQHVGHVLPASNCALASVAPPAVVAGGEIGQAGIAQRPPADRGAIDPVGPGVGQSLIGRPQASRSARADRCARRLAHRVDRVGIGHRHLVGEERLARQRQRLGGEGRVGVAPRQRRRHRLDQRRRRPPAFRRGASAAIMLEQQLRRRIAGRIPSARTDRCRAPRGSAGAPASCRTASPARRSRAAATAPAALAHPRRRSVAPRSVSSSTRVPDCAAASPASRVAQFRAVAVEQSHRHAG